MGVKLTASLHGFYRKNGRTIYRFLVTGSKEDLKKYEDAQGPNFRTFDNPDDANDPLNGTALYFSPRPIGKQVELDITQNDRVVVKEDIMSVMDKDVAYQDKVSEALAAKEAELLFKRKFNGIVPQ